MSGSASTTTYVSAAVSRTASEARAIRALARDTNVGVLAVMVQHDRERRVEALLQERSGQDGATQLVAGRVDGQATAHRLRGISARQHGLDGGARQRDVELGQLFAVKSVPT